MDRYFANDCGEQVNAEGLRKILEAQAAYKGRWLRPFLRRQYERDLMRTIPVRFDPETLATVRKQADKALSDPTISPCFSYVQQKAGGQPLPRRLEHEVRRAPADVKAAVPNVMDLLSPKVVHAIRSCIGSNFTLAGVYLNRTFHVEPDLLRDMELLAERWHFDHQSPDIFSLFVYLSDVTERDGPFHCINSPGSQHLLKNGFDPSLREKSPTGGMLESDIQATPGFFRFTGPSGSALLCHTSYCLHRSDSPAPGHTRDLLTFMFHPSPEMGLN